MKNRFIKIFICAIIILTAFAPMTINAELHVNIKKNFFYEVSKISLNKGKKTNYDMIIIAPSYYNSSIQPLIEHKNSIGIITKFISLDDIYNEKYFEDQGRDNPEKIKYFIKNALETWEITYVLFVGKFTQVPVRFCYNNDNYSNYEEPSFVSELYYADIYDKNMEFSSWDNDNDQIYGEWDGDVAEDQPINLTPDICLGRLACIDKSEVKNVVNKIIDYEKKPADLDWFKRLVVVGGDTYSEFEGYEGEIYNKQVVDVMSDFTPIKLWASTGKLITGWNIVREVSKGCGFWYLSGHGNHKIWATYDPEGSRVGEFDVYNTLFLRNYKKLPVCLVGGCHNSEFSIFLYKHFKLWNRQSWMKECWSWRLVSKPNGGSIATLGATGLSWYSAEYKGEGINWLNLQFFKEYVNDTLYLGKIWKNSLNKYITNFPIDWNTTSGGFNSINAKSVQEWTLLGDPSLRIGGYPENEKKSYI